MGYIESVLIIAFIYCIAVLGMVIFTGFTGLFSLGHAAFMGIGAYTAAILTYYYSFPFLLALLLGGLFAVIVSIIIGIPTLKANLRSDYFAITILGFGEAVRVILENLDITQGARGLPGIPGYTTFTFTVIALVICIILVRNFILSKFGWKCIGVREDAVAAEMMGIDLFKTRLLSLAISAFFAGFAGGLLAHYLMFIQPVMFTRLQSTQLLAPVVAGGIGSITGPILATLIFMILPEVFRIANLWRFVIYGALLVVIMVFRPQGIMGYRDFSWKGCKRFVYRLINRNWRKDDHERNKQTFDY
jgi:branched-chain amino acid transport system permease protein